MRTGRFLLPFALSLALVGCDAWMQPKPVDDAMMRDDAMMKDDSMMKKDDAMMDGHEGEWTDEEMKAMEGDGHMMEGEAMMKDDGMKKDDAMMKAEGGAMMEKDGDAMMKDDGAMAAKGSYAVYAPGVLADGETKVLFFHAAWCPTCKKADANLNAWYAANAYGRSVYKVDYDTSNDLKAKYGVTYQHTFVLVDGQGNALQVIQGPTDAQLQALLQA